MCGGRRGSSETAAVGPRDVDGAGVQMQPVLDVAAAAHVRAAIFEVADDRRADRGQVDADLMRAAGQRLDRQPGEFLAGGVDHDIVGDRVLGALARGIDRGHALVAAARAVAAFLRQRRLDRAALDTGHALDQRPVDLLRVAGGQRARQLRRGRHGARDDEDTGGIAVETVDETRARAFLERQAVQHAVDMLGQAAAALGGEARRLVQDNDVLVHVDDVVLEAATDRCGGRTWAPGLLRDRPCTTCGGRRTVWPAATRSADFARLPSSRICPVRSSFSSRPWVSAG